MAAEWLVTFADGSTTTVRTVVGDVVAFELEHDGRRPVTSSLADVTWLVWRGAKRLGHTIEEFQDWADGVSDFDPVSDVPLVTPAVLSSRRRAKPA